MSALNESNSSDQPKELPPAWQGWNPNAAGAMECAPVESADAQATNGRAFVDFAPAPADDVPPIWTFPNNDDGRAAFLLQHFGPILRYVPEREEWRIWHDGRWHPDQCGKAGHLCQLLSRHQLKAAAAFRLKKLEDELADQIKAGEESPAASAGPKLKRAGLEEVARNAKTRAAYRQSEDELGDFISECTQDAEPTYVEPKDEVSTAYLNWCDRNGIRHPMSGKQFTRRLGEREGWVLNPGRRGRAKRAGDCHA